MKVGIAINMQDDLEEKLQWAHDEGFEEVQLQLWDLNHLCLEHAKHVKGLLELLHMTCTGLWCGWHGPIRWTFREGPSVLGLVPTEYRATRMQNLLDGAAYARELGVRDLITHLGFVPTNCADHEYLGVVYALQHITQELQKYGQRFLMETGQEPPIVLLRLIQDVGAANLRVNYDPANLMMYGSFNPLDGVDMLKDYICSVHAKDGSYPTDGYTLGEEFPIGKGKVDFPHFLAKLKEIGFHGPISIEHEIEVGNEEQKREILEGKKYLDQF